MSTPADIFARNQSDNKPGDKDQKANKFYSVITWIAHIKLMTAKQLKNMQQCV